MPAGFVDHRGSLDGGGGCNWENRADTEAIEKSKSLIVASPLEAVELDFKPDEVKACCWANGNPPSLLIDGDLSTYHDWGWNGDGNYNGSDFFVPSNTITYANCKTGHTGGHTNALSTAAHFYTLDLGEVKQNIWRVGLAGRNDPGSNDNRTPKDYEIWISDTAPIGIDPANQGATKAITGTWPHQTPLDRWRYADFTSEDSATDGLPHARYIQIRSLNTYGSGDFEFAAVEVKVDILGDFDGSIDLSSLTAAYTKGIQLLKETKSLAYISLLEKLLYGEFDQGGELVAKGAKQLLEGVEDINSGTLSEKIAFQQDCDRQAKELAEVCNALLRGL